MANDCLVIGDGVPEPETDNTARIGRGNNFLEVRDGKLTLHGDLKEVAEIIEECRKSLVELTAARKAAERRHFYK